MEKLSSAYMIAQTICISVFASLAAYFDSTIAFVGALFIAFIFNILAGFRADEVQIKIQRIFPPIVLKNFQGNKFKDSLMELVLITFITYLLKVLIDLMNYENHSAYVVQFLIAIAIYFYLRNSLRNLVTVYPRIKFLRVVYYLIAFKFKQLIGNGIADIVDKVEEETKNEENNDYKA